MNIKTILNILRQFILNDFINNGISIIKMRGIFFALKLSFSVENANNVWI